MRLPSISRSFSLLSLLILSLTLACPGPNQPPTIYSFIATPSQTLASDPVVLSWQVSKNFTSLSIDHGVGDVTNLSSVAVHPADTTTYTLTTTNAVASNSLSVTVVVPKPIATAPVITGFIATPSAATVSGQTVVLSWTVIGSHCSCPVGQSSAFLKAPDSRRVRRVLSLV